MMQSGLMRHIRPDARHNDVMREVIDGVIEIPIGYVNAYAVVVDDGVVLIDTGLPGRADKVASAVAATRHRIGEVHTILLTHWHPDHVGGVAELRRRSGARIVAHAIDTPLITGEEIRSAKGVMRVVAAVMPAPERVPVDETLTGDGPFSVPGFTCIPRGTPAAICPSCSTAATVCSLLAMQLGVAATGGYAVHLGWSPRTARPSRRASPDLPSSISRRLCSGMASRFHAKRRCGSAISPRG